MAKFKFSLAQHKAGFEKLVSQTDQKTLAVWAIDCAERVMPYFEEKFPDDPRPRNAIKTLQIWIETGVFKMAVIRKASLDSHAAARDVSEDNPARSAAHAAGQAVATAHVPTHSIGAAIYGLQAIHRASNANSANPADADAAVAQERDWQYQHLLELGESAPRG
jgi:immunity protein 5 of polymorphic toxin system